MPPGLIRGAAAAVLAFAAGLGGAYAASGPSGFEEAAAPTRVGSPAVPLEVVPAGSLLSRDPPAVPALARRPPPPPQPAPVAAPAPRPRRERAPRSVTPATYAPAPPPAPAPVPVAPPPPPPPAPAPPAPSAPRPDPAPPLNSGPDQAPTFDDSG